MKKLLEHLITFKNIDNKLISSFQGRDGFILGDFSFCKAAIKIKTPGNKFLFLQIVFFRLFFVSAFLATLAFL